MTSEAFIIDLLLRLNARGRRIFLAWLPENARPLRLVSLQFLTATTSDDLRQLLQPLTAEMLDELRRWNELPEVVERYHFFKSFA